MMKLYAFLFAGLLVLSCPALIAAENSDSDDQVDLFATQIFSALAKDSDETTKPEEVAQEVQTSQASDEQKPEREERRDEDSENDDDAMTKLASEVLKIMQEDDAKETPAAAEAEPQNTQNSSTEESTENTSDGEADMAELAQEVAKAFGQEVEAKVEVEVETESTTQESPETTEDIKVGDEIDVFTDKIFEVLEKEEDNEEEVEPQEETNSVDTTPEESEQETEMEAEEEVKEETQEEAQEETQVKTQTEEEEEEEEEDIVELVTELMKELQAADDKKKRLSNPDIKDVDCAQEVSASLETLYSFAHDALEDEVTKIQQDYEALQVATEIVNNACFNSFSINMKPKPMSNESSSCLEVLSNIITAVATFKNGDTTDVYNFAKSAQSVWYQNENFVASCIESKPEEPEQVPVVESEPEEQGDMISIDCLLSYAEGINVLYNMSNDIKKLNVEAMKTHIKALDAKIATINSSCDARFNIEAPVHWSFAEPTCEEDFAKLKNIISGFEQNNNGDIDFIAETVRKVKLIGDQILSDC